MTDEMHLAKVRYVVDMLETIFVQTKKDSKKEVERWGLLAEKLESMLGLDHGLTIAARFIHDKFAMIELWAEKAEEEFR